MALPRGESRAPTEHPSGKIAPGRLSSLRATRVLFTPVPVLVLRTLSVSPTGRAEKARGGVPLLREGAVGPVLSEPRRAGRRPVDERGGPQRPEHDLDPRHRPLLAALRLDDLDRRHAREERPRPGAFTDVTVPVGGVAQSPVIPQTAIRPSEKGFLAFVVEDGKARERVLTLRLRTTEGLVEVRSRLKPGQELVIRGAEALRDGLPVKVSAPGAEPTTASRPETRG